ncbi:MAG: sulfatase-like hydrolase/transferase [Phycisphaeraceae bacterium]|nr:sulfatase-like hydrolase/transferase [Phycisphaeraceae bacterium]
MTVHTSGRPLVFFAVWVCFAVLVPFASAAPKTNFLLCMTDDQGWGDVGYNGHKVLKTPHLDEMARVGIRFDRFYVGAPICSPSRGGFMTGRAPARYGIKRWGYGLRPEEFTLAELAQAAGYATAHLGKWHLGPVKKDNPINPHAQGFEHYIAHDNFYDIGQKVSHNGADPEPFEGDTSDHLATVTLDFIKKSQAAGKPFLAVVWFPSPHSPHKGLKKDLALYPNAKHRHYLAELTAVDRAMGTLRRGLRQMNLAENTLLFFCSDNGPTGAGRSGGLRGKKGSLWEGGIRVPGLIEWPARVRKPFRTSIPATSMDLFPTMRAILKEEGSLKNFEPNLVLDGLNILPLIDGQWKQRPKPIGFGMVYATKTKGSWVEPEALKGWWRSFKMPRFKDPRSDFDGSRGVWLDNNYKLKDGKLYDLADDMPENKDIASAHPERTARMKAALAKWQAGVTRSLCGEDYRPR